MSSSTGVLDPDSLDLDSLDLESLDLPAAPPVERRHPLVQRRSRPQSRLLRLCLAAGIVALAPLVLLALSALVLTLLAKVVTAFLLVGRGR